MLMGSREDPLGSISIALWSSAIELEAPRWLDLWGRNKKRRECVSPGVVLSYRQRVGAIASFFPLPFYRREEGEWVIFPLFPRPQQSGFETGSVERVTVKKGR